MEIALLIILAIGIYPFLKLQTCNRLILKSSKKDLMFLTLGVDFYKVIDTQQEGAFVKRMDMLLS